MTVIGIQNPKLIVTNDYQQFLAHFDCFFLSMFQIYEVKLELMPVKLYVRKNGIFRAENLFQQIFPRLFLSPIQIYVKIGSKWPLTQDAFQRLPLVGLNI